MIVALLWFLSFFLALPLIEPEEYARLGAVTCALLAAAWPLARGLAGDGVRLPGGAAALAAGLFWCAVAASILWSPAPYISIIAFFSFSLMPLAALGFLLLPVAERARALRAAAGLAGAALGALALSIIVQYMFFWEKLLHERVYSPFANLNSHAALLAAGYLPVLVAGLYARGRWRLVASALMVVLLTAILLIGGRGVPVVLAVGALAFLLLLRDNRAIWGMAARMLAGTVAVSAVLAAVCAMNAPPAVVRMVQGVADQGAVFGRLPIWQAGWAMIRDHVWTGTGIGTFYLYYPAYRLSADQVSGGYMMHNDPLQFWAEAGIAGFLLFYAFIAAACVRMARRRFALSAGRERSMATALFCALGIMVVHAHGDFEFYTAAILALCGFGIAWWYSLTGVEGASGLLLRLPRRLPATAGYAVALLPVIGCVFLLQGVLLSERAADTARVMALAGQMDRFGNAVNRANRMGFGLNARPFIMAAAVPLGLLEMAESPLDRAGKDALYRQTTALLDKAQARNQRLVAVPYYRARLALLYRPAGARDAVDWLHDALALNPQHLPARLLLADLLKDRGQGDDAYAVLKEGLDWPYHTHDPREYYQLVAIRALQHNDTATAERVRRLMHLVEVEHNWVWPSPDFVGARGDDIMP